MSPRRPRVPLVPGAASVSPPASPEGAAPDPSPRPDRRGGVIDLHAVQQRRGTDGADRTGAPIPTAPTPVQDAPGESSAGEGPASRVPPTSPVPPGSPRARRAAVAPRRPAGRGSFPAGEAGEAGEAALPEPRRHATLPEPRRHATLPEPVPARQITGRSLLVVLSLLAAALLLTPTLRTLLNQQLEISAARTDIAAQESRQAEYEARIRRWDDPQYVAQQARERLDLVMPGETLYTVTGLPEEGDPAPDDGGPTGEPQDAQPTGVNERLPWVEGLWDSVVRAGTT